jgi:UDP-N-acetylmuramoylalanine--D-glutamate ligase
MSTAGHKPSTAVIAGLGRTGLSCARYLRTHGWRLAVTDTRPDPPQLEQLRALDPDIVVRTGGLDPQLLDEAVYVLASPGLPLDLPFFVEARRRGLEICGDIELFARAVSAPVGAITGTNGKSTVTSLVGRMAARAGLLVRVGGNLGEPALDLLAAAERSAQPTDLYVLELSSFQLDTTESLDLKAAAVLNVSADHLDRYASLEDYALSKARVFARCDTAVVNLDDALVARMPRRGQRLLGFSLRGAAGAAYTLVQREGPWLARHGEPLLPVAALRLRGAHNAANALAALALGEALELPRAAMLAELREFTGLAHRTQWVAELRGVTYINDSKGTNVGATLAAVAGMDGPLVLIAGGEGKNQDFTPLAAALRGKARHVVLIGRDAERIGRAIEGVCTQETCASMSAAVAAAARAAVPGDTVLLSPACASLDMFRDYAHRGESFAQAVRELPA